MLGFHWDLEELISAVVDRINLRQQSLEVGFGITRFNQFCDSIVSGIFVAHSDNHFIFVNYVFKQFLSPKFLRQLVVS